MITVIILNKCPIYRIFTSICPIYILEMLLVVFIALAFVVIFHGIQLYLVERRYDLPPGPRPYPFFGSIFSARGEKKIFKALDKLSKRYGPVMTFYMGQIRMIVVSGIEEIQEAIVVKVKVFSKRPIHLIPALQKLPTGVLLSSGDVWQRNRRFSLRALRDFGMGKAAMIVNIHEEVGYLLASFESHIDQEVDPEHLLTNGVSNVICSLVFGRRFDYDDKEFARILQILNSISSASFASRFLEFFTPFLTRFISPHVLTSSLELKEVVERFLKQAIEDHRKDFSPEALRDFPDYFILAEKLDEEINFDNFANIMVDLFLAGTETTSTLLNWTLLYLSKRKDVQQRCHEEIDKVIRSNRLPTLEDRPNLVYIDAVLNEIMRFVTIAPQALFHANVEDADSVGGYEVPANSLIMYNVWGVHNDPSYWKNPDEFDPDRWIGNDGKLLTHSTHFMPFGVGPRICLGELLAKAESFIFLVAILQRFKFSLSTPNVSVEDGNSGVTHSPPHYKLLIKER